MLILNAADVRAALPMLAAIDAMRRAFLALTGGRADVPRRIHLDIPRHNGISLTMPAFVDDDAGQALAVKVVNLFARNAARGLARIQSAVIAMEPDTGRPLALLDGAALTAIRTGAASGLAADLLARADSATVALFGAGVQARTQLEAVCCVRKIHSVRIYDPSPQAARTFAEALAGTPGFPPAIHVADSPRAALAGADIALAATTSRTPIFDDADLPDGSHVSAIGSYQPDVREIPAATVARARVFVDSRPAALEEAGDLILPIRDGLITPDHIVAEMGELLMGQVQGRTAPKQVTFFKSVGVAVQDALAAQAALARANEAGLGQHAEW